MNSRINRQRAAQMDQRVLLWLADGPKTTQQLAQLTGKSVTQSAYRACLRLARRGLVVICAKPAGAMGKSIQWARREAVKVSGRAAAPATSAVGIDAADRAWQAYWRLPKAERRALPPPDFDPTFPRTGGVYDQAIPQPSHASRNAWRISL